jgi:hypothetical protein
MVPNDIGGSRWSRFGQERTTLRRGRGEQNVSGAEGASVFESGLPPIVHDDEVRNFGFTLHGITKWLAQSPAE